MNYQHKIYKVIYFSQCNEPRAIHSFFCAVLDFDYLATVGWFAGSSLRVAIRVFKDIEVSILVIIILVVTIFFLRKWSRTKLIKMRKL